jgi:hypothetical protein
MARAVCDVCNREGEFDPSPLRLAAGPAAARPMIVGQCPRCHRFICSRHAEPLPDGLLGCPFEPGVPLGDRPLEEELPGAGGG